jgi:transposase
MANNDDIFDPSKIIEALRAKGIPDSQIEKMYGPIPKKTNPEKTKKQSTNKQTQPQQEQESQSTAKKTQQKKPRSKPKVWSQTETDKLKILVANGYSARDISKEFNVSIDSITSKLTRLKNAGWDGTAPETPEEKIEIKRFQRVRDSIAKAKHVAGRAGHHTKRAAKVLNEHYGHHAARHMERNFGVLGHVFNKVTGLGQIKIDEQELIAKLNNRMGTGTSSGVDVEAINKSNEVVVGSLSRLNRSIAKGTNDLGKTIAKSTTKVLGKVENIERATHKLGFESTVEKITTKGDTARGTSLGKMALVGGIALASGVALSSLLSNHNEGDTETTEQEPTKEKSDDKKPIAQQQQQIGERTKNEDGSEDLTIKAQEIDFKAKNIKFEYDTLKIDGKDAASPPLGASGGGSGAQTGGATGSWENQTSGAGNQSSGIFPTPSQNPVPDLSDIKPNGPNGTGDLSQISPESSSQGLEAGREKVSTGLGVSKESVPDWAASATVGRGQPSFGALSQTLAGQRAGYMQQFQNDPALKEKMAAIALAEEGGDEKARMALVETALNRGASRGIKDISKVLSPAYYQPFRNGQYDKALSRIRSNPALRDQLYQLIDKVGNEGTNVSNLATDNASGNVKQNAINRGDTLSFLGGNGEGFFRKDQNPTYHGVGVVANTRRWYDMTTQAMSKEQQNGAGLLSQQPPLIGLDNPFATQQPPQADSGNRLIQMQGDIDMQDYRKPAQPSTKKNDKVSSLERNISGDSDSYGSHVLETQGPNHFDESGFPSGDHGILS